MMMAGLPSGDILLNEGRNVLRGLVVDLQRAEIGILRDQVSDYALCVCFGSGAGRRCQAIRGPYLTYGRVAFWEQSIDDRLVWRSPQSATADPLDNPASHRSLLALGTHAGLRSRLLPPGWAG